MAAFWALLLCLAMGGAAAAEAESLPELTLSRAMPSAPAWPAVRVLADPMEQLDSRGALAALPRFQRPDGPHANLGARAGATWLHLWLKLDADAPGQWLAWLDYALLWRVDLQVYDAAGRLVHDAVLGASVPFAQREQATRALSTLLQLQPGQRYQVLLRVATPTATLLPLHFMQPAALGVAESREQALQGVMTGLWLFMIIYSLATWAHRRQGIFLAYAGSLLASWGFTLSFFGHGAQYLWPQHAWPAMNGAALCATLMIAANVHFFIGALDMRSHAPRSARALRVTGALAALLAVMFALDLAPYAAAAGGGMLLGLLHLLMVLPVAVARVRQGDRAAAYLLAGCVTNIAGITAVSALLRGVLPVNFLSQHAVQIAFAAEMVWWLMVLGARLEQLREAAAHAQRQHDRLHALAHTDALTGLRNRRGLEVALEDRAARGPLALFMLDLDSFKPVNDRWGHDSGDELLRQVGARLASSVRPTDVVARLGGDEFVVSVRGLRDAAHAEQVGRKLRAQFDAEFDLGDGRQCHVGATVGFAFALEPGPEPAHLLRAADAAMYRGKQAGKNVVMAAVA
ncbi:diguanylate cyclase (GGDEF) domain-containing protein [Burkholderiales bacterium JOSHI_001]|nr:diguanylate cyclase (GGDEF) domain-containing protein [Burkholderiales bacterium JOSHI_001]